ncbi:hypothetical protein [Pseudoxanthomonas indica]|uniref:Helix-turn-helix domain-containing protein n=1 Tax=Pseudoxanthomonas indica TaxID=428993 RepID=A0A1T5LVX0_9GAMM|nr:hypothetical protein [Pseudoxanthomonas indica]GGD40660.1 hypothetical protein GCM10007235_10850 [Pseudoxanthomonas indica]SKC80127.1 hypothetical protein SAMN06296058_3216 [Pseudoxanthomonas indica]
MARETLHHDSNTGGDTAELFHAATTVEAAMRFGHWCDQQRHLTAQAAIEYFGLQKATAYRWINAYRAARGISP